MLKQIIDQSGRVMDVNFHNSDDSQEWFSFKPKVANLNYEQIIGKKIYQAKALIVEMLKDPKNSYDSNSPSLKSEPRIVEHTVRYYEKGDNPIEYLTSRQWFVKIMDKKNQLLNQGSKVNWFPSFMEKRYSNWTDGLAHDWAISRQRYFGVPIPIWYRLDQNGDRIFGDYILNVSNAGTGPMHAFVNVLNAPCVSIGSSFIFCRMHSPNEFAKIDLLKKTTKCFCVLIENFSRSNSRN